MSRSYKIKVRASMNRVIRAEDHVGSSLELLEILPCDQMSALLAAELQRRDFQRDGELLVRHRDGVRVEVDPAEGSVTVSAQGAQTVTLEGEKEGLAWDGTGPSADQVEKKTRKQLKKELAKAAKEKAFALRGQLTDTLEGQLNDLRQELDQAVNRVTGEALKIKAAQIGQIKELTEDPQSGSLTIVVEV